MKYFTKRLSNLQKNNFINSAFLTVLGGADIGSTLITGPAEGRSIPVRPMSHTLDNVHEVTGTGTLFPDENGKPTLHMHISCGRNDETVTGCVREGVTVWNVLEVILVELLDTTAARLPDKNTGFSLLEPSGKV